MNRTTLVHGIRSLNILAFGARNALVILVCLTRPVICLMINCRLWCGDDDCDLESVPCRLRVRVPPWWTDMPSRDQSRLSYADTWNRQSFEGLWYLLSLKVRWLLSSIIYVRLTHSDWLFMLPIRINYCCAKVIVCLCTAAIIALFCNMPSTRSLNRWIGIRWCKEYGVWIFLHLVQGMRWWF